MALALHVQVGVGDGHGLLPGVVAVGSDAGAHLLLGEGLTGAGLLHLHQQDHGVGGNGQTGHLGDVLRALAHGVLVHLAAGEDHVADGVDLLGLLHIVSAVLLEGLDHVVIHGGRGDGGLLAGADDAVIELASGNDHGNDLLQVHVVVDDALDVAAAHAVGGSCRRHTRP